MPGLIIYCLFLFLILIQCVYIFWHVVNSLLSLVAKKLTVLPIQQAEPVGNIAILYTTCDDFNATACNSLLQQKSVNKTLFILDDSTLSSERQIIDTWATRNEAIVVRRSNRNGYKAGNINNWLRSCGTDGTFTHILIADADCIFPEFFSAKLLHYAQQKSLAFVQGCHSGDASLATYFQKILHYQVVCEWLFQLPAKNILSMPTSLGHGVLLKIKDVLDVGGYRQIISEDLALTIDLAKKGKHGFVADKVLAKEEFPPTYKTYWRRRFRWIIADTEVCLSMYNELNQNSLGFIPKIDLWLREARLPLASIQWLLLLILSILPVVGLQSSIELPAASWLLTLVFIFSLIIPVFAGVIPLPRAPLFLGSMIFVGISTITLHPLGFLEGIFGKKIFTPTGSKAASTENYKKIISFELMSGAFFFLSGFIFDNLVLAACGLAIFFAPFLRSRAEKYIFFTGTFLFWILILSQITMDLNAGYLPPEHILPLIGTILFCL